MIKANECVLCTPLAGPGLWPPQRTRAKYLPGDRYARRARVALAEERDPVQHVRWLIKRAVAGSAYQEPPMRQPVEAGAAT